MKAVLIEGYMEKVVLSLPAYAPVLPGIPGTVYTLHKKYTIDRDRRIFEDVKQRILMQDEKLQQRLTAAEIRFF